MSKRAGQLLWLSLLVLGVSLIAGCSTLTSTLKVGDVPPPKLTSKVNLSNYRGRIVIVSFWASWCSPCRQELPFLAAIQKQATRNKLVVFAVDYGQDSGAFRQISKALRGLDLTLLSDPNGYIGRQYGVDSIPHMVVIGRNGRIAAIHIGYSKAEMPALVNELNSLLMQPSMPHETLARQRSDAP